MRIGFIMKKIIVVLLSVLIIGANAVYAINIEKIPMEENMIQALEEKKAKDVIEVDTSNMIGDDTYFMAHGNGVYLRVARDVGYYDPSSTPPNKLRAGISNSPLYIYDEDLNLINTVEFNDYMYVGFFEGYFYISICAYDGQTIASWHYYKTLNGEEWEEITYEEQFLELHRMKMYDGNVYTWKYFEEGNTRHNDRIEYIIDPEGNTGTIECENNRCVDSEWDAEATDYSVFFRVRRDWEHFNDSDYDKKYISIDGVSMYEIPFDTSSDKMWNDDTYLYMIGCVKVKYNNKYLSFESNPTTENDRTLVPMRFLFEQMGAEVEWEEETQTAVVTKDEDIISFSIDNNNASVNGNIKTMDVPARLINDKTMIPVRFLSEELGCTVEWDEEAKMVIITDGTFTE